MRTILSTTLLALFLGLPGVSFAFASDFGDLDITTVPDLKSISKEKATQADKKKASKKDTKKTTKVDKKKASGARTSG